MPGYKALPHSLTGNAADQVREAETRHRAGDLTTAAHLLEEALEASATSSAALPGWLCGRLAALYRTLARYDDEVRLLERYRESQTSEDARTRYDARLSKARTIAERRRRSESTALTSVRASLGQPRPRRSRNGYGGTQPPCATPAAIAELEAALADASTSGEERRHAALRRISEEARELRASIDEVVAVLKRARDARDDDPLRAGRRAEAYGPALVLLIAMYFQEE